MHSQIFLKTTLVFNSELNSRRRSRKESNAGGRHQQELPLPFPDKHSSLEFAMQIQDSPSPITKYQLRKFGSRSSRESIFWAKSSGKDNEIIRNR